MEKMVQLAVVVVTGRGMLGPAGAREGEREGVAAAGRGE